MLILAVAWLVLLAIELTRGLSPALETLGTVIWIVFIVEFLLKLTLAPHKLAFVKRSWLTIISLIVPALRVLRITRAARILRLSRTVRSLRLVKVIGSLNRGIRSLGRTMERRGLKYVLAVTIVVIFAGAAAMQAFERDNGLNTYSEALWWTTMIITTLGSDQWPRTGEGRILCLLLAIYAFTVFGYVTASLASAFIDHDKRDDELQQLQRIESKLDEILASRSSDPDSQHQLRR